MTQRTGSNAEVRQLQALLALSRELMQVDKPLAALTLAGRALAELGGVDDALLLVRGEVSHDIGFDRAGMPHAAGRGHAWHGPALARLEGGPENDAMPDPRTLLVGVPVRHAMAALAAGWPDAGTPAEQARRRRLLGTVLELSVATLCRISARDALEDLVSTQYAQMAGTARAHADELARRDDAEDAMRALALTDILTGLNNRRGFFVQAEHMFRLARRKRASCMVIYADIDGLKLVNDQLGHETGDQLIRDAAAVLRESLRDTDVLARLGGDEFVAFALNDVHPRVILSRLRENLHAFNLMQDRTYALSISAGVVRCDTGSDTPLLDYVQRADQEMYAHKRSCLH
ncbi:diguanylate cyclase [Massilia sp. JS1662]|nr:GGDEF domain-containing protein [Massilia sp. JS1662]KGF79218.1 diguanylate cyclase [Massilia sp. JS1662]